MKLSTTQTAASAVLALALGAGAAVWRGQPAKPALPEITPSSSAGSGIAAQPLARPVDPALARDMQETTGAKRWLLMLAATENAKPADMPALILAAGKDSAAVRMLGARWAEMDPKHMFQSLHADFLLPADTPGALPERWALTESLFEHWTQLDAAAVRKALTEVPDFSGRQNLRMTVANHLMKVDVEAGLTAMQEWGIRNYIPDMKKVAEWAAKDPAHAAEVVVRFGEDHVGREALKHIAKSWAQQNPEEGLRFAGKLRHQARAALASELISQWSEKDLAKAADFVSRQEDVSFRSSLAQGLVKTWGKSDPSAALAWCEENLRGIARTEVIGDLVKAAAEKDLNAAAELVSAMQSGPAQNRACASIFETWFNKGTEHRTAALEWLGGIQDLSARQAAFERVQWNWVWRDPDGVRDFLKGPHGHLASESIIHQVARAQGSKNPEQALEWAASLPADRSGTARNAVLEAWLSSRPESAASYVRKMPAGADRDRAITTVSNHLIWQSPRQAGDWYRSLPTTDQTTAKRIYDGAALAPEKRAELNKALAP